MASKDNKTSKTARVMNLLSKKQDPAPADGTPETAGSAAVPPIVSSLAPDAAISAQIKDALEGALEGELGPQAAPAEKKPEAAPAQPEPEPAPAPQESPVEEAAPIQPEPTPEPEPAPAPAPEPVPEPAAQPEAATEPAPTAEEEKFVTPAHPGYINVMQVLVEEKAEKYIKMFGLCQCERCLEDVKALTLNNLPPKYVVLEKGDWISRLTVYEGKFSSDITAQLLHACQVVMKTPHHSR